MNVYHEARQAGQQQRIAASTVGVGGVSGGDHRASINFVQRAVSAAPYIPPQFPEHLRAALTSGGAHGVTDSVLHASSASSSPSLSSLSPPPSAVSAAAAAATATTPHDPTAAELAQCLEHAERFFMSLSAHDMHVMGLKDRRVKGANLKRALSHHGLPATGDRLTLIQRLARFVLAQRSTA